MWERGLRPRRRRRGRGRVGAEADDEVAGRGLSEATKEPPGRVNVSGMEKKRGTYRDGERASGAEDFEDEFGHGDRGGTSIGIEMNCPC